MSRFLIATAATAVLTACGGGSDPMQNNDPPLAQHNYFWTSATPQAEFAGRDGAGALVFDGKVWLLGGWRWASDPSPDFTYTGAPGCCTTSEVWNSSDAIHWTHIADAPWEGRHMAGWAKFKSKLWVVGGDDNSGHYQPDVWNSNDGIHWNQVSNSVPWSPRVLQYVVASRENLYVIGGQQLPGALDPAPNPYPATPVDYDDVWSSNDGARWTYVGNLPRALGMICGAAVFAGEIWVIGGGTYHDDTQGVAGTAYNEVWSSPDGATWTQHAPAPWPARRYHNLVVFDNRLWVLAGIGPDGSSDKNDVWYSSDGESWAELPGTPWVERHAASVFAFKGSLWITGGTDDGQVSHNDVWQLQIN